MVGRSSRSSRRGARIQNPGARTYEPQMNTDVRRLGVLKSARPLSKNLSACISVNLRLNLLFFFVSIRVHSRLNVLTGVDIEGNNDRLFPGGGRLFEVG